MEIVWPKTPGSLWATPVLLRTALCLPEKTQLASPHTLQCFVLTLTVPVLLVVLFTAEHNTLLTVDGNELTA